MWTSCRIGIPKVPWTPSHFDSHRSVILGSLHLRGCMLQPLFFRNDSCIWQLVDVFFLNLHVVLTCWHGNWELIVSEGTLRIDEFDFDTCLINKLPRISNKEISIVLSSYYREGGLHHLWFGESAATSLHQIRWLSYRIFIIPTRVKTILRFL